MVPAMWIWAGIAGSRSVWQDGRSCGRRTLDRSILANALAFGRLSSVLRGGLGRADRIEHRHSMGRSARHSSMMVIMALVTTMLTAPILNMLGIRNAEAKRDWACASDLILLTKTRVW